MDTEIRAKKNLSNIQIASRIFLLTIAGGLVAKLFWTNYNTHDPGISTAEALNYSVNDVDNIKSNNTLHKKNKSD